MARKKTVDVEEVRPVEAVPFGEFVRVVTGTTGKVQKKTYVLEEYDRGEGAYYLTDCDDCNHWRYLKRGRLVLVGFTY